LQKYLEPEFSVVDSVGDGVALIEAARRLNPDIILTDISMPRLNGMQAVRQLRRAQTESRVIFLTVHEESAFAAEAKKVGAAGYVVKRYAASHLIPAIHAVLEGNPFVCPAELQDAPFPGSNSRAKN
jgi:DNA-binding NarL/FixJ family response regulator